MYILYVSRKGSVTSTSPHWPPKAAACERRMMKKWREKQMSWKISLLLKHGMRREEEENEECQFSVGEMKKTEEGSPSCGMNSRKSSFIIQSLSRLPTFSPANGLLWEATCNEICENEEGKRKEKRQLKRHSPCNNSIWIINSEKAKGEEKEKAGKWWF